MGYESEIIQSLDGLKLHAGMWSCENPKAMVCVIHGFGEHSARYEEMAQFLNEHDILVASMDLRGHGLSEGLKGHAPSMDALMNDIEELLKYARAQYNDLPLFLMGHSLGGNLVSNYILRKPINELEGFIVSSPWLQTTHEPPRWKVAMGNFFSKVYPRLQQPTGMNVNHLSKDPEAVKKYQEDPLVHETLSAGLFSIVQEGKAYVEEHIGDCKLGGYVYHGDGDQIISHDFNEIVFKKSDSIEWKSWPGVFHEPHHDLEKKEIMQSLLDWILKKLNG